MVNTYRSLVFIPALGLILLASIFLFYGDPNSFYRRSLTELWNQGHVVYFILFGYLLAQWPGLRALRCGPRNLVLLLSALALGLLIEWAQAGTARSPDRIDVARDLIGCLLVIAFYAPLLEGCRCLWRNVVKLIAGLLFVISLIPLLIALVDESIAQHQFPLLADFETPFELGRWEGSASMAIVKMDPQRDQHQLQIDLTTDQYSGISLAYFPADWRDFKWVSLRLFQPRDEMLEITVRIHDQTHETSQDPYQFSDRFNRSFPLKPGWNTLHIPLSDVRAAPKQRPMDMSRIRDLSLFSIELPEPRTLYLDRVSLSAQ